MNRIKWYHFYILLATFDILVIAAGLWLHNRTLARFGQLLSRAAPLDARQRDLTSLGQRLVALNAPGNDVFESRDVGAERARFHRLKADLTALRKSSRLPPASLASFWEEVESMCEAEQRIFDLLEQDMSGEGYRTEALLEAGRQMAVMDKRQATAMKILGRENEQILNETAELLYSHEQILKKYGQYELVFVVALLIALVGMFWYGLRLQKTDTALTAERERAAFERRERLAAIGELCSGVAHGIQNPLAAIRSSTELIMDLGQIDPESRRRAQDVMTECERLGERVARLLGFARAERSVRQSLNLDRVLEGVFAELESRFRQKNLRIVRSSSRADLRVWADPDELASIFIELLSNALDHSPPNSDVTVHCRDEDRVVSVEVTDEGPGVPPGASDHIFDLFFTTKPGGTGIGLASARRIVTSMNGSLELVARPRQQGATFRVSIPKNAPIAPDQSAA